MACSRCETPPRHLRCPHRRASALGPACPTGATPRGPCVDAFTGASGVKEGNLSAPCQRLPFLKKVVFIMKSKICMRERAHAQSTEEMLQRAPGPSRAAWDVVRRLQCVPLTQPPPACSPHPAGLDFVLRALFVPVLSCDVKGHVYARVGRCHSVRLARCPDSRRAGPEALAACLLSAEHAAGV